MKRAVIIAAAACALATLILACARTPEARTNATAESSVASKDGAATAPAIADASAGRSAEGDAHALGLPMPQQFPRLAWDAAGYPRDGAAR